MSITVSVAPAEEPISLEEAKGHLRVEHEAEDELIFDIVVAARQLAELYTGRALVTRTYTWKFDDLPQKILIPYPPLGSVTSITYVDTSGVTQTLASDQYTVDTDAEPAEIIPDYGGVWPTVRGHRNDVTVVFTAGYGARAAVPSGIKRAMLLLIGEMYERREQTVVGTIISDVPLNAQYLLDFFRNEYRVPVF